MGAMTLLPGKEISSRQAGLGKQENDYPVCLTTQPAARSRRRREVANTTLAGRHLFVVHSNLASYELPRSGLRWLRPVMYLRLNIDKLLDNAALARLSPLQTDQLAKSLIVRDSAYTNGPDSKNIVHLRICPQKSGLVYEFIDRNAHDLVGCYYIFARIVGYKNREEAMLNQLSAPSFSGKKAMSLIWNFMAIAKIQNMLFSDVSTIVSCCDDGALTSLHLMEIFEKGKSWYTTQGASSHIKKQAFRALFETEFIDQKYAQALKGKLKDKRIHVTQDYEQFFSQYITMYLDAQTGEDAYSKACSFLHRLQIGQLENAYSNLMMSYPDVRPVYTTLLQSTVVTKLTTRATVGTLIEKIVKLGRYTEAERRGKSTTVEKVANHVMMHAVRDYVISNKSSVFFRYIIDKLKKNQERADQTLCAFVFLVLDNLFKKLKGLSEYLSSTNKNYKPSPRLVPWAEIVNPRRSGERGSEEGLPPLCLSPHGHASAGSGPNHLAAQVDDKWQGLPKVKLTQIVYSILNPQADLPATGMKDVTRRVCQAFLTMIESRTTSPVSAKILLNSNYINRAKWMEYSEETGSQDDMTAPQAALHYFANLTIAELRDIYPELVHIWEERYEGLKGCPIGYKVTHLIADLEHDEKGVEALFDDLLRGAVKHLSKLSLALFDKHEKTGSKNPSTTYELFMISKYLCKRTELFAFYTAPS